LNKIEKKTEIYIVAGFLGAGKTTLIQKLATEAFQNDKVAILENDFGEASVDAALLGPSGIEVAEINSGCICCTMTGNFVEALKELLGRFEPDKVIIEPSGVAKLSDVAEACLDRKIAPFADLRGKITVIDAGRCKKYLDNFGEFYEDQIEHADIILLNRLEDSPGQAEEALESIEGLNKDARILTKPWNLIGAEDILSRCETANERTADHSREHDHDHDHTADDFFDVITLRPGRAYSRDGLTALVSEMERSASGTVIRGKGIVRGESGYWNLQYIQGDLKIESTSVPGDLLCFIGRGLDRSEFDNLFCDAAT
jgi:G3E family GTPase